MVRIGSIPFYIALEDLKEYIGKTENANDIKTVMTVAAMSRVIEKITGRKFYPTTEQRKFDWQDSHRLCLDYDDLLSVSAFADDDGNGSIATSNVVLIPANENPKYEILIKPQNDQMVYTNYRDQAIHITGDWGYSNDSFVAEVTSPEFADETGTSMALSDGSIVQVGHTILINSERMFVEDLVTTDFAQNTSEALDIFEKSIDVPTPGNFAIGEVIRIDDEDMLIERIDSGSIVVERGYNATVAVTHVTSSDIHVYRTYTVQRGVFGSTAATHSSGDSISILTPPHDIIMACGAMTARAIKRGESGWADVLGGGDAGVTRYLKQLPDEIKLPLMGYTRSWIAAI